MRTPAWDLVVVGAGPAGAAAALGALHARPDLCVALLDRADFPRDKACGDGVAPHVLDLLDGVGVTGLLADRTPVRRLRLERGGVSAVRCMARPAWVVPRTVLDARLVEAAVAAGAVLHRHRVRTVAVGPEGVQVDGTHRARVLVGADGAHSVVGRVLGRHPGRMALAVRGYAPTHPERAGEQHIVFGTTRQPSYAWSFDCGDGLANVGYGEVLTGRHAAPTRSLLLRRLDDLLPGAGADGRDWRGHHLPLSSATWSPSPGRVLLAGDAAGLVNPLTGEGIYYAVATGLLAGRAAASALTDGDGRAAGVRYRRASRALLVGHLRHTALAARLTGPGWVLDAGLRAAAGDQHVFDDLVELGLARGRITPAVGVALVSRTARDHTPFHRPR